MDLLDDILSSMDKNKPPPTSQPDKMIQSKWSRQNVKKTFQTNRILEKNQEMLKYAEKERQVINNFKVKIQHKVSAFLKEEKHATMQFDPMEKIFRSVIIETIEESNNNLHCHVFGREDRYVVVYKNPPSELEIEARKYFDYTKWNREIEAEYKKKKEEAELATTSTSSSSTDGNASQAKSNKRSKLVHLECEAIGTDLNRNYGMVSTELKSDKRSIEQTLNDIQEKKRLKTQNQSEQT